MLLFAHAGHVLVDSLVYGGPVVVLAGAIFLFARFEGRLAPQPDGERGAPPASSEPSAAEPSRPPA